MNGSRAGLQGHLTVLLNGEWAIGPGGKEPPGEYAHRIPVPALVDAARPAYAWEGQQFHWYRWHGNIEKPVEGDRVYLVVEQAMFGTFVIVNGVDVGGDIACYTSQEYDITACITAGENEILIRVGDRATLPPESAVGKDQERKTFIPGIWGDVRIERSGIPRIRVVQMVPHVESAVAEARITLENPAEVGYSVNVTASIRERKTGRLCGRTVTQEVVLGGRESGKIAVTVPVSGMAVWSPASPFLYECLVESSVGKQVVDSRMVVFGMREFRVEGRHFFLNGKRIRLRGGNIAFHRFLSDDQRGLLPWNPEWIRRALIDLPKEHNFNFFRNHIGQMYNRWYDIADEHGMLLQNEWQFWTTSGTKEQIVREFTRWIEDNANHPSIVIWDPLNESSDAVIQDEVVPMMKELDPTRPWESVDFVEEHPYIYSLGPVLNEGKFGFTRGLGDIEKSNRPTMLNEFVWWWLDRECRPTSLMEGVVERWLGPEALQEEILAHQSFLATELVELFRRMDVDAIQPFVYLSNDNGPTAHWFMGEIAALTPKPILAALKNAFSPLGISIELWDRHFFTREERTILLFVFNDTESSVNGIVHCCLRDAAGCQVFEEDLSVGMGESSRAVMPVSIVMPQAAGTYVLEATVTPDGGEPTATSRKICHVFERATITAAHVPNAVAVLQGGGDVESFLQIRGITVNWPKSDGSFSGDLAIAVGSGIAQLERYGSQLREYVHDGGSLLLFEPELECTGKTLLSIFDGLALAISPRKDLDKGGYDSYVFPADSAHPVWRNIAPEHLRMFNGALGGEMVSQHDVEPSMPFVTLARCGLHLKTSALMEVPVGSGSVVVCRIQIRGRLLWKEEYSLYGRREDPVAQQLLLNLIAHYSSHDAT